MAPRNKRTAEGVEEEPPRRRSARVSAKPKEQSPDLELPQRSKASGKQKKSTPIAKTTAITKSDSAGVKDASSTNDQSPQTYIHPMEIKLADKKAITEYHTLEPLPPNPGGAGKFTPKLIFTHGAGGDLSSGSTRDFARGFASVAPVWCFQGSSNLIARRNVFNGLWGFLQQTNAPERETIALGGRSLGARAAVVSAASSPDDGPVKPLNLPLVLVSYPLSPPSKKSDGPDPMREGILLSIPAETDVLFILGSTDGFCSVEELRRVVGAMKARIWVVIVEGMDHGMSLVGAPGGGKGKASKAQREQGTTELRLATGRVAAEWVLSREEARKGGDIERRWSTLTWDWEDAKVVNSGWKTGQN